MPRKRTSPNNISFEESLSDDWGRDLTMVEVPLGNRPLLLLGIVIAALGMLIIGRVVYLNASGYGYYAARAAANVAQGQETPAPRGMIYDREGDELVANKAVFAAYLDARQFIKETPDAQSSTVAEVRRIFGTASDTLWSMLAESQAQDFATPVVLADNLTQAQLVNVQALGVGEPAIRLSSDFERTYPQGAVFSSVVGYIGRVTQADLKGNPKLTAQDFVGKAGIEKEYDSTLEGVPGVDVQFKNAQGKVLRTEERSNPAIGGSVHLTVDGGLQAELHSRLASGLASLGRQVGLGLAIDPRNGQVLSLVNLPGYNDNVFSDPASNTAEIENLLTSNLRPLFDRAVSGFYNPGSTIKPLDGVAILKDGVIDPKREIFSPGYLMVPNPYNSSTPTKYLDWRYQGNVDLASALAQSSDVYFYVTVGGSPASTPMLNDASDYGVKGLGIDALHGWWQRFGLGTATGIDLPGEADGFLPTPDWKRQKSGTPWLLGDTYNVAIGQGDLLVTPVQLLSYIGAIANGGTVWRPYLNQSSTPKVNEDLTSLLPQIQDVQQGMRAGVTSPLGTAYTLHDLPFPVCAKTGSAQVQNNQQENALFVGYAPCDDPQIAILILIENSREGSLNAVPIAKDVLSWYYENRIAHE
ncbi:MAG TPA: penicillin-binding transpeptidase domain-containing protein [Candidatus Paceibacterota bacterium]|nr:penicillin-binding transpeptidase domain-containing protein [Candidatus Paceibacterota bacterium]